jgi:hypothetical protein
MTFSEFEAKLNDLMTNDTTALLGTIKLTVHEREELHRAWNKLDEADRARALDLARGKGVDVRGWS